jgi:hypothetical protein
MKLLEKLKPYFFVVTKKIDQEKEALVRISYAMEHQSLLLMDVLEQLKKIQLWLNPSAIKVEIKLDGLGENEMLQVAQGGSVLATLEAKDAQGHSHAKLDSVPVWSLSDPAFGTVNAAVDGMTAVVVLADPAPVGTFMLHVEAVANGVTLADDSDPIEVVAGAAALLQINVSAG